MVKVQILGIRCPRCNQLHENALQAAREVDIPCEVKKIASIMQVIEFDPPALPALAINGKVRSSGKVLSQAAIKELILATVATPNQIGVREAFAP